MPRYSAKGVYERMAKHRTDFLSEGVWESMSADAPFHLRTFRVFISIGIPDGNSVTDEELIAIGDSVRSSLLSIEVPSRALDPVGLLALIDDFTSPTTAAGDDPISYNQFDPIADQAVRRDMELVHLPHAILIKTERLRATGVDKNGVPEIGEMYPDTFESRSYSPRNLPPRWAPWDNMRLIGDLFTDKLRLPCPVATVLCRDPRSTGRPTPSRRARAAARRRRRAASVEARSTSRPTARRSSTRRPSADPSPGHPTRTCADRPATGSARWGAASA